MICKYCKKRYTGEVFFSVYNEIGFHDEIYCSLDCLFQSRHNCSLKEFIASDKVDQFIAIAYEVINCSCGKKHANLSHQSSVFYCGHDDDIRFEMVHDTLDKYQRYLLPTVEYSVVCSGCSKVYYKDRHNKLNVSIAGTLIQLDVRFDGWVYNVLQDTSNEYREKIRIADINKIGEHINEIKKICEKHDWELKSPIEVIR